MTQAEKQLLDEYPIAPLYFYVSKHLVNPAVRNFEANILDIHPSQPAGIGRYRCVRRTINPIHIVGDRQNPTVS